MSNDTSDETQMNDSSAQSDAPAAKKKAAKKATKKTAKKATKKAAKKVAKKTPKAQDSAPSETSDAPKQDNVQLKPVSTPQSNNSIQESEQHASPKERNEDRQDKPRGEHRNSQRNAQSSRHKDRDRDRDQKQRRPDRNKNFEGKKKHPKNNRNNHNKNYKEKKEKKPIELKGDPVAVNGMLELAPKGFGFIRVQEKEWEQSRTDVFVTPEFVRKNGLRHGAWITGFSKEGPRGPQLVEITNINGYDPEKAKMFPHFDELKAINPDKRISVETTSDKFTTRVIDIIAPIGRGQRGLIVSPPRSGKTTILVDIAEAILENHEDTMKLIVLLVDERPEEVTDFKRRLPNVEIFSSSNDSGARNHCRMAELCIDRAKRLVEAGEHVFVLMDSITRLARAYNYQMNGNKQSKGKGYQSGGLVAGALETPRRLFAAARNTRTAGSLTIVATALIQTNSRADEAIFQEFKGTGNMELVLDRRMAEQYLYPAVDIFKSGTRREELLLPEISLHKIHLIRRGLAGHRPEEAVERLLFFLKRFHNNAQMLLEIKG